MRRTWARTGRLLGVALIACTLLLGAAIPAAAAELMRVTFVRHGQSAGNASGLIDTSTPGPVLTPKGQGQAQAVADLLGVNNYDSIYASNMVRTQLTGAPMSQRLGLPIQVLPGLQEIEAGVFEGTPESQAANGYGKFPLAWTFAGQRDLRIPGSIDGNEFDSRVDGALQKIYDNGDRNAVVFSHGGTIMFWTMMNATNLTMEQKINLLRTAALDNTDYVVIEGNPEDGWKLVNWNGQQFGTETTVGAEVGLQVRTLARQLAATAKQVVDAFATLNPATVVAAIIRAVGDATASIAKFAGAVTNKVVQELGKFGAPSPPAPSTNAVSALASTTSAPTGNAVTANAPAARTVASVAATADAVVGDAHPKAVVAESTPIAEAVTTPAATVSASAPSEAPKPEAVETPKAPAATNGASDLKDGNKAVPGTTPAQHSSTGDKPAAEVSPTADTATSGSESESKSEAAAG